MRPFFDQQYLRAPRAGAAESLTNHRLSRFFTATARSIQVPHAIVSLQGAGVIGWWCKSPRLSVASTRIRAAQIMRGLDAEGLQTGWFDLRSAADYRCVVLSKRQDAATVATARRLRAQGCRVVVDFCDNNFLPASASAKHTQQVANLKTLVATADAVVAATAPLAHTISEHCPTAPPAVVIGDVADDLSMVPLPWLAAPGIAWKRWRERAHAARVAGSGAARLVWFGNHGGRRQQSGLVDLARLCPLLERLHGELPLHLTVISNSRERYQALIAGHAFPSHYVEWDPWTFSELLAQQQIALIPSTLNSFTVCKTDNRVVTALRAGLAVVADSVPSYKAFADTLILDDFEAGLRTYIGDPQRRQADAARGRVLAEQLSAPGPILDRWREVLGMPKPH